MGHRKFLKIVNNYEYKIVNIYEERYLNRKFRSVKTTIRKNYSEESIGYQKYFHNNGKLNVLEIYDEEGRKKLVKEWEEDGTLIKVERYKEGRLHGMQEFFCVDGSPLSIKYYNEGEILNVRDKFVGVPLAHLRPLGRKI